MLKQFHLRIAARSFSEPLPPLPSPARRIPRPLFRRAGVYSLNRNWLFGGKTIAGADAPAFDDSKFRRVTLPHTKVELPWHSFNDKRYEFISIYRRRFHAPAAWSGKRVFADFGGVTIAANVTVNGHHFEEYRGGSRPSRSN